MKEIHNRTIYDTDKATLVYDWGEIATSTGGINRLYRTEKGNWFFHRSAKNGELERLVPIMEDEIAIDWLEEHAQHELLLKYFADQLSEA